MTMFFYGICIGIMIGATLLCAVSVIANDWKRPTDNRNRCKFCGGKLSEIRENNGVKYRHCYGCHFDYEVTDDA